MKDVIQTSVAIANELAENLARIDTGAADALIDAILSAKRVFSAGCGRSLLMIRGLAMRLMHLGLTSYVVGETVTPAVAPGDLLIIGSGSGETGSLVTMAQKAKKLGVKIALITIYPDSTLGNLADIVLRIPGTTGKSEKDSGIVSVQPGGNMFEQSMLLFGDALVICLADRAGMQLNDASIMSRHANLE
ncbi:6-phospho-3-hexuloisomerase [Zongyangia hominis]|uniref:6-phospho-3-hexuloisomerase n=1 Tax=Zongyangia hominis TaxID=2763677 RepID=A0A926IBW4_9FIRM|nr:6-phospho-3-hexuloisomerase [Zongyangia hominis]MBC8570708.1 6-phospho-3-hexuloisomerase [Zongyangia hominis]